MSAIFSSTEFWAALFGALAAFLLEALRRWASDRRHELAAGNEAVFALAQMHTLTTAIYNQTFLDRAADVRRIQKREPVYFDYLPMPLPWNASVKLPLDRLGFILGSYHPDLLNRLAVVDREFASVLLTISDRNAQHLEFQHRHAALPRSSEPIALPMLENMVGIDLSGQLRHSTEFLQVGLPRTAEHAREVGRALTEMLSNHFPVGRITSFTPIPRTSALDVPKVVAPAWRRWIRGLVTRLRGPTGVVFPPDSKLH